MAADSAVQERETHGKSAPIVKLCGDQDYEPLSDRCELQPAAQSAIQIPDDFIEREEFDMSKLLWLMKTVAD